MIQELVRDWMTTHVLTVRPDTSLPEADRLMTRRGIRRLPVVHNGRVVGIVTRGDVREARPSEATSLSIWEINYLLSQLKVEQIMSRNPITISDSATISEAAQIMLDHKISGLPVLNNERELVGIITESDIFRLVAQQWQKVE